jgi:RNA polymerase sigma-70 factor, ECF subfamily
MMTKRERLRDEQKLRRYLLGRCSPQESDEIDEAIVVESDVSDLLEVLENEIAEDYVTGELDDADRLSFERQFLNNEERLRNVRLSAMLLDRPDVVENLGRQEIPARENSIQSRASIFERTSPPTFGRGRDEHSLSSIKAGALGLAFFAFDKAYVERLRNGDLPTEQHFGKYFEQLLRIKLRARRLPSDQVEDLCRETLIRVVETVRRDAGVRKPERFAAFVNAICNNVLMEHYRSAGKNQLMDDTHLEIPDKVLDLEGMLVGKEASERMRQILEGMPKRDRDLLRAIFFEEKDKDIVCKEFKVDRDYLRVLIHRAKQSFRTLYLKSMRPNIT